MEMILHLQNLPQVATSLDIRHFFGGLDIPVGGVQIIGGEDGNAFINFCNEQDLLQAFTFENKPLLGQHVKLFLAKEVDVHRVIEKRNRELDRAKANFLRASSHGTYTYDHDLDDRDRPSDRSSSTNRADSDVDENSQDHSTPDDPTNLFVEAIYQLLEGDSSSVKPHTEKRSGDHSRDHPSHSDKKLKLEGDEVVTSRERDFKKRQEAKPQNQKHLQTGQSQSVWSAIEDYEDRDDRPQGHRSRGKCDSTEGGKTGVRYKGREEESPTDKGLKQEISKSRDKGKSSKGKQTSHGVSSNRDKEDKGLRAKHGKQDVSRSTDRKDKSKSTDRGHKSTTTKLRATRGYTKEDKSKDKGKKCSDKSVRREQQREKSRDRSRDWSPETERGYHTKEHKTSKLDCIALYHLDITVTASDIRKFLKLWEIPDGGIILRADKHNPNALIAYVKYFPRENVEVKSLINTFLNGRPVDVKSLPMEIFRQEKLSDHKSEETTPAPPPAPATGHPTYSTPSPGMYPHHMGMPRMPMAWYGPPQGIMGPPRGIMGPPQGIMGLPRGMIGPFPPRGMMPVQRTDFPQGKPPHPSPAWPPFSEERSSMRPVHPVDKKPLQLPPVDNEPLQLHPVDKKRLQLPPVDNEPLQLPSVDKEPVKLPCVDYEPLQLPPVDKEPLQLPPVDKEPVKLQPVDKQPLHYIEFDEAVLPANCTASEVWSWFDGPSGQADHAILITRNENVPLVAYVAFLEESKCNEELATTKERKGVVRTHLYMSQVLRDLKREMQVLLSTESGVDKDISAMINPHSSMGIMHLNYLEVNACMFPPQCSASEVWFWFGGPNGKTKHVLLVATEKLEPRVFFVGYFEAQVRNREKVAKKLIGGQCTDYRLSKVIFGKKNIVVLQSTVSGVDKMIWGEIKPNSHTTPTIPPTAPTIQSTTPKIPPTTPTIPPRKPRIPPTTSGIPLATPRIPPPKPDKSKEKGQSQASRHLVTLQDFK